MLARDDPWQELAANQEFSGAARSRALEKGVWELSVEGKPEAAGMAVFSLMALLGFVVLA